MNTDTVQKKPKLWSFMFIRVGIVTALTGITRQMFMSAFPQYLSMQGFTATQMGLVASGYTIFAMISRILSGNLVDKQGRQNMLLLGLVLFGLPILGFMGSTSMVFIVFCRMFQGVGSSLASISTGTMSPDILPKERMAEGIGYYGLFNSLATAIGPALGIGLLVSGRSNDYFMFSFAMLLIAVPVALTINYEKKQKKEAAANPQPDAEIETEEVAAPAQASNANTAFIWKFIDKKALPAASIMALISFSTTAISNFITPYSISIGITSVGSFFTVQAMFMIVSRISSNKISSRIGVFRTLILGLVLDIGAFILIASMQNTAMMYLGSALRGLGGGITMPLLNVLAVQNASKAERGKATSSYYLAFDVGSGIGATVWGFVADNFGGYRTVYAGAAAFYIVTILASFKLIGKDTKRFKEV